MIPQELNFRSLPTHSRNALNPHGTAATAIPFQPLDTTRARPSSSRAGRSRGGDPASTSTVIPFLPRRSSRAVDSMPPRSQSAVKSLERADQNLTTGEAEYRQRMFENLLAAGWVGTLMTVGYYMGNVLAAPPM
jgi:hypothetical protein